VLDIDRGAYRVDDAREHREAAVAQVLKEISAVGGNGRLQHLPVPTSHHPRRFLVALHQCRVAYDIGEHHGE
jgi:hypothetical protein